MLFNQMSIITVLFPQSSMDRSQLDKEFLELEMEIDRLRWEIARENAEDLVRARGWSENDEDFLFQVEDETKRQWEEDFDREMNKRGLDIPDDLL